MWTEYLLYTPWDRDRQFGLRCVSMDESRKLGTRDIQSTDSVSGSSGRERPTSPDTVLSAVANDHRRAILNALENAPEKTLAYDELVGRVAEQIRDEDVKRDSDEHRQRVRIALHHTHLPKLAEARMIDYNSEAGNVEFVGGELEQDISTRVESHVANE